MSVGVVWLGLCGGVAAGIAPAAWACPACGFEPERETAGSGLALNVLPEPEPEAQEAAATPSVTPSPAVTRLLDAPVLDADAKRRARVLHGRWDELDEAALPPALAAQLGGMRGRVRADLADAHHAAAYFAARAALRRGDPTSARRLAGRLPDAGVPADETTPAIPGEAIALLHARLAEQRADFDEAALRLRPIRERFLLDSNASPAALTAAADGIVVLAALEGRPASDYRRAVTLLETALDADPLYWPAKASLAALLADKDNPAQAIELAQEALALNPQAAEVWETLGHLMIDRWDFVAAQQIIDELTTRVP
ncbi:MAG: hypothetical protein AAGE65_04070, partial [Planctomycetota bacterium]